jgi:hypothetical protein
MLPKTVTSTLLLIRNQTQSDPVEVFLKKKIQLRYTGTNEQYPTLAQQRPYPIGASSPHKDIGICGIS